MKLIVGLGNPGRRYARHRHNVGFMAVDRIAEDHRIGPWRARFQGLAADGRIKSHRVTLLKPETYMNDSGRSAGQAMRYFKLRPADIIVLHDELDLTPGRLRAKSGGGTAGHRGLNSVRTHLGGDFARVRIGIGHPGRKDLVNHYVLHDFSAADADWLEDLLAAISRSAAHLAEGSLPEFTDAVARHRSAPAQVPVPGIDAAEPGPSTEGSLLSQLFRRFKK